MHNPIGKNKIIFEKPDARYLSEQGYMCIDTHVHSKCSDGSASISSIMKKAKKKAYGIAITDHNEIKGSLEAFKKSNSKTPVIPALEVSTSTGPHLLLFFYGICLPLIRM